MKTDLLYLEDTYLFKGEATFLETRENEKGLAVVLDKTIFYPQGGGQPSDTGTIKSDSALFNVTFVGLDEEGVVWHFGVFEKGAFTKNEEVILEVDGEKRKLHARIHSAGHLIDCAIQDINVEIKPDKGFHFAEGPYIESVGEVENKEKFKEDIEQKVNELVQSGLKLNKEILSEDEAKNQCVEAPLGKSVRMVGFKGYEACGCGGTHVTNSSEIGNITIRKVSSKKGKTKISYAVL